jgi:polysaccharide biosynthesis transport protein
MFRTTDSSAKPANRRRLLVFLIAFGAVAVAGLWWNYARPAIYMSSTRAQVNPGSVQVEAAVSTGGTQGTNASRNLMSELQVITSRPLVQQALDGLPPQLKAKLSGSDTERDGADAVAVVQAMLQANVLPGTDVVELTAKGRDAAVLPAVLNGLFDAYKLKLDKAYQGSAGDALRQIADEVAALQQKVDAKRREIEGFRVGNNIVSIEREENEVLARVKGQTEAMNKAQERLAVAEGKLRAMEQGQSANRAFTTSNKPNPALESVQTRISTTREEMAELQRNYTQAYLDMDPRWKALRSRLSDLERQQASMVQVVVQESKVNQSAALADAREEVVAARDAAARLRAQIGSTRGTLASFSGKFQQFQSLQKDLAPMEGLLRDATQRKARMESTEASRRPSVQILEPAVQAQKPWQPEYTRDAALVLAVALAAALLSVWIVEMFNREGPQPTMVVAAGSATYSAPRFGTGAPGLAHAPAPSVQRLGQAFSPVAPQLSAPSAPRELLDEELQALLANATKPLARYVQLMLRGLRPDEARLMVGGDIDASRWVMRVRGAMARDLPVDATMLQWLANHPLDPNQGLLAEAGQPAPSEQELSSGLLYAAHDAGLDAPAEVNAQAIWHTAASHLARQGVRLSELAQRVGHLDAEQAALYGGLSVQAKRSTGGAGITAHGAPALLPAAEFGWDGTEVVNSPKRAAKRD